MPKWTYANDPEPRRYNDYGDIGPGDVVEADSQPDWRWEPVDGTPPAPPAVKPEPPKPPAEPETPAES